MIKPKDSLYQQAVGLVQQLSQKKLRGAIDYLMYLQGKKATEDLLALTEKADPVLAELWNNEKDAAYDRL